jgi:protein SCO1/2
MDMNLSSKQVKMMKNNIIIASLTIVLIALCLFYVQFRKQTPRLSKMPIGGDFKIESTRGVFNLKDHRGKVVLLYFGFTFCPDICPTTLASLSSVLKALPAKSAQQFEILFISVDPKRDTIDKLKDYVSFFYPQMIGATTTKDKIDKIAKMYGVTYKQFYPENEKSYYTIDHSTQTFIINRQGQVSDLIVHDETGAQIQNKLKKYIVE